MNANEDDFSDEKMTMLLNCYDISATYLSYVQLLKPDNTMLDQDGTTRDVSGELDFNTEAQKGKVISSVENSTKDSSQKILRNAIPVMKDGNVIYILYGIVQLDEFAQKYDANIYDGEAYIFVEDGNTGDFILDTWHKTLGNVS